MTKIYQATLDGFDASNFHSKVDGIKGTLTIIKSSNGNIFGGFTRVNWGSSPTAFYSDPSVYIFSLVNQQNFSCKIFSNNSTSSIYSNYASPTYGPTFGVGHDFYICNQSNSNSSSYSNLGHTFTAPLGYAYGSTAAKNFLAGSYNFLTTEIEVYTSNNTFYYVSY
jgi:hypothetical protein